MDSPTTVLDRPVPRVPDQRSSQRRVTLTDGAAAELEGTAPAETLRFFAPGGNLLFEYDAGPGKARISIGDGDLEVASGCGDLVLRGERRVRIEGETVEVTAARSDLRIGETRFVGQRVRGWVADVRLTLGRMETLVGTVIRKAQDVYDAVEGLAQLRTGRLRTIVKGAWHARSRDTVLTAERDFDIDGEKIHLG